MKKYILALLLSPVLAVSAQVTEVGPPGAQFSIAFGMSSNGDAVGIFGCGEDCPFHSFWYHAKDGTFTDLGEHCWAEGINDQGDIVGEYQEQLHPNFASYGFLYRKGQFMNLNDLMPSENGKWIRSAHSITNNGRISAEWQDPLNGAVAIVVLAASATAQITEVGPPGASFSIGFGMNSHGDVVGIFGCGEDCPFRGYWYHAKDGTYTDLGIHAWAMGINDQGDIVGEYQTFSGRYGFLLRKGVLINLNDLLSIDNGKTITSAHSITNDGRIAAEWQDLSCCGSVAIVMQISTK